MNKIKQKLLFILLLIFIINPLFSQVEIDDGDPLNNINLPVFFKSKLSDIDKEIEDIKLGEVKTIATSPGGLPIYAVYYGEKENFDSKANYNSAIAAKNPVFYAKKDSLTKPVVFFIGPVHGQEIEGIVGLVNLIHIAETGKDHRGKDWSSLKNKIKECRTIIIPCANPDGRKRCPYDSFIGLPSKIMTKYGQGTRKDGTLWGWPQAKSVHPMQGDVGILGAYFNDDGVNLMQDEYFSPMAKETEAILKIARTEAPDITVSLHSHSNKPIILSPMFIARFMKDRTLDLTLNLNEQYRKAGLASWPSDWMWSPKIEDENFPPKTTFNLISALHHISGTMAFTFECPQGFVSTDTPNPIVSFDDILDIQLILYEEMFDYILKNRLIWN